MFIDYVHNCVSLSKNSEGIKCGLETADMIDIGTVGGAQVIVAAVDTKFKNF